MKPHIVLIFLNIFIFTVASFQMHAYSQEIFLPESGVLVNLSSKFNPPILKGLKVHPDHPFKFDFILDQGDSNEGEDYAKRLDARQKHSGMTGELDSQQKIMSMTEEQLKLESTKLIKYFLASLTIPQEDLWVNLSPYEKDRIVPEAFGQTEMGRDLLAQDYLLKQITASLMYPEDALGKKFWKRIYEEAQKKYGNTNIPVNTFNKVWIVPEKAIVYENAQAGTAYVVESRLKVMLEEDYLATTKNQSQFKVRQPKDRQPGDMFQQEHQSVSSSTLPSELPTNVKASQVDPASRIVSSSSLTSQIIKEIILPELTKEVNEGKNFAQLRQVYNSLILATWYKTKIKNSIINQVYANKRKVSGIGFKIENEKAGFPTKTFGNDIVVSKDNSKIATDDSNLDTESIYQLYLKAFKKGVYNYIKEENVEINQSKTPKKYFAGGVDFGMGTHLNLQIKSAVNEVRGIGENVSNRRNFIKKTFLVAAGLLLAPTINAEESLADISTINPMVLLVLGEENIKDMQASGSYKILSKILENKLLKHDEQDIRFAIRVLGGPLKYGFASEVFSMNKDEMMLMLESMENVLGGLGLNAQEGPESVRIFLKYYRNIYDKSILKDAVIDWKNIHNGDVLENLKMHAKDLLDQKPTIEDEKNKNSIREKEWLWEKYFISSGIAVLSYYHSLVKSDPLALLEFFMDLMANSRLHSDRKEVNSDGYNFFSGNKELSASVFIGIVAHELAHKYFPPNERQNISTQNPVWKEMSAEIGQLSFTSNILGQKSLDEMYEADYKLESRNAYVTGDSHYIARRFLRPFIHQPTDWSELLKGVGRMTHARELNNLPQDMLSQVYAFNPYKEIEPLLAGGNNVIRFDLVDYLEFFISKSLISQTPKPTFSNVIVYVTSMADDMETLRLIKSYQYPIERKEAEIKKLGYQYKREIFPTKSSERIFMIIVPVLDVAFKDPISDVLDHNKKDFAQIHHILESKNESRWPITQFGGEFQFGSYPSINNKGGIDLASTQDALQIQFTQDESIAFHLNPAMLKELQNSSGLIPTIFNIQPLHDVQVFLEQP